MIRLRTLGLALVAVFAVSAVMVGVAFAASEKNPQWFVAGKALAGEKAVEGEANGNQELITEKTIITAEITIVCTKYSISAADIIAGAGETPGSSKETITYSGCTVKGFEKCTVKSGIEPAGTIKTEPLKDEQEYATKAAAEAATGPYLTLFKPATGKVFVALKIEGTCPSGDTGEHKVEGQVLVEDPKGEEELEVHELIAPATPLTKYWHNVKKVATEATVETLKVSGLANSKYVGKSKTKLTSKENWSTKE